MFLQIAWRNIWRNPRRTGVILTAVVIGVWSMIFMSALMRGMELGMVKNGLETMTGNIQIHHPLYRQDPVLAIEQGRDVPGQRAHGVFFENRIYLFADEASLDKFRQAPDRYAAEIVQARR